MSINPHDLSTDSFDETPDPAAESAWTQELERRLADFESGRVKGVPAEEVFAKLREKYPRNL